LSDESLRFINHIGLKELLFHQLIWSLSHVEYKLFVYGSISINSFITFSFDLFKRSIRVACTFCIHLRFFFSQRSNIGLDMYLKYFYLKNSIGKIIIFYTHCVCSEYMKKKILYFVFHRTIWKYFVFSVSVLMIKDYESVLYFVFQIHW